VYRFIVLSPDVGTGSITQRNNNVIVIEVWLPIRKVILLRIISCQLQKQNIFYIGLMFNKTNLGTVCELSICNLHS